VLSWDACEQAARALDADQLLAHLAARDTAKAEDMMRHAVVSAQNTFDKLIAG
jgi:xylose isomerase